MFADTHCHLRGDLDAIVKRAKENGVEIVLTSGLNIERSYPWGPSSVDAIEVAKTYDIVYACVGIHPWVADQYDQTSYRRLKDLTREEKVVAISETGLDFAGRLDPDGRWGNPLPKDVQIESFRGHVKLAGDVGLPIIIHSRGASAETLKILKQERAPEVGGALHGFAGDLAFAKELIDLGFYISIGLRETTPGATALQDVIKEIPIEKLVLETDSTEPANVKAVAELVSKLKGISIEEVGRITTSNLRNILKI